jgi:hypothetical protein
MDVKQLMAPATLRGLLGIVSIIALLAEHCDFDKLRTDHEGMLLPTSGCSP